MPLQFGLKAQAAQKEVNPTLPRYSLKLIGSDTEIFLRNKKTNKSVPVIGLLGGTKEEPLAVPELGAGFAIQEDNVMPEFNIPASKNAAEFSANIALMLDYLTKKFDDKGLSLDISPSCFFTPRQLDHPQALRIGCEGDYCVWTRSNNPSPAEAPELKTMRSAGGHVHVSFLVDGEMPENILETEPIVKGMDAYLGIMSIILDGDTNRKKLYGKAGAFRPKPYGIEYRTLSNFWIKSPEYSSWVFSTVSHIFSYLADCRRHGTRPWWDNYSDTIPDIINQNDVDRAKKLASYKRMKFPEGFVVESVSTD